MQDLLRRVEAALEGRYVVERELGRGGMAVVFLGRDVRHGRAVAIKFLRPELAASLAADRFLREIAIASRLTHPHILPLHDSGEVPPDSPAGFPLLYYVMPYVEGESLRDRLQREGPLPIGDALRLARGAAAALAHAHAHGVVHRDIKPENILLEDGEAVVADFGLARALDAAADDPLSLPGLAMGTPAYMSPEQSAGAEVDARTDIYSLGCVLYEMLAGEPPFSGSTPQVVQARHRSEPPRPLTYVRPNLPPELQVLLDATLAKLPADRPATAATVVQQLDALLGGGTGSLSGALPAGRTFRRPYLMPAALGLAGLGVLLAIGAVTRGGATGEPAPVIVAEFEGPAAEVELTRAFRELLIAGLGESARLALIPPHQIREAMRDAGMADSLPLTPDRAREIAFRLSVRAVVNGAVRQPAPGRYALMVSSVDAESGRMLTSETESASESTFVPAVQRITSRLRRSLGDRRADIEANKPLWQVATPSFEAFRKYVQAVDLGRAANLDGSNRLLREAIAIDTGFASAWGVMGMNFIAARNLDSARVAFAEALRRPGRLNDAQRYRMEAEAAYALHHDLTAAVHWYGLYLQEVPLSVGGRNNRGLYLSAMGRLDDALADFVRAVELERGGDAVAQPQLLNAAIMLWALGRSEEARRYRARLSGPFADYAALVDVTVEGSWTVAESLASRITADPAAPSWVRMQATGTLASALAMRGDIAAARRLIDTAAATGGTEGRWYLRAARLMEDVAGRAGPLPGPLRADTSVPGTLLRAEWLAAAGDTAGALAALDAALDRREVEGGWFGFGVEAVRARILGARGDWGQAARLLSPLAVVGEPDNTAPDRIGTLHLRWLAADAWERAGWKDSADAYHARLGETTRLAANQLALRGLVLAYSSRRLARLH